MKKENPTTEKVEVKQEIKTEVKVAKAEKLLRGWSEITDKMSASDPSAAPFLKMSKAYILPDDRISIRFQNSFVKDMLLNSSLVPLLYSTLETTLKRQISKNDVEFIVSENTVNELDDLEDIIQ